MGGLFPARASWATPCGARREPCAAGVLLRRREVGIGGCLVRVEVGVRVRVGVGVRVRVRVGVRVRVRVGVKIKS